MAKGTVVVIGAGDATGGAIARRFARAGYPVAVTRRPRNVADLEKLSESITGDGGVAHAFGVDGRDEEQTVAFFKQVEEEIGPIEVCVFNIGGNVNFSITETTARVYTKVWEMCALAGFLAGREAAKYMIPRAKGTIIFTGATASVRGSAGFSAFAGGKHALRALAQSMARELGPKGIHVAHTIIDGAIDTKWIAERFPERYASKADDGILQPDDIAENYLMLHNQPRSAWTFELDLRPWMESW
jgi:NAD(P)-dependent dehydrogenase (short-subunit alcohol dehydrogenase family)